MEKTHHLDRRLDPGSRSMQNPWKHCTSGAVTASRSPPTASSLGRRLREKNSERITTKRSSPNARFLLREVLSNWRLLGNDRAHGKRGPRHRRFKKASRILLPKSVSPGRPGSATHRTNRTPNTAPGSMASSHQDGTISRPPGEPLLRAEALPRPSNSPPPTSAG